MKAEISGSIAMSLDVARQRLVTVSASPPRDAPVQGDEGPEWLDNGLIRS